MQSTVRVLSRGRVPRCSSPRQRSDMSRGAHGRDETWHVRPERRQIAAIKPRTVALEGQEQQRRRFRLQWLHCRAQVGPKRRRHQTLLSSPKARRAREHLGGQAGRWRANSPCLLWRDSLWLCFLRTCCGACCTEKETNRQRPHRRQRAMHASAARSTLACTEAHARRIGRLRAVHMRLRASTLPVHRQYTCTRGAPALRQPAYNYPCRRPRSRPRRLGHGEGHGRSQRGRGRTMHAGAASNSPVRG